jgi:hypothetical protein
MENKTPRIRSLAASDKKLALFAVGKANLENLAVANRQCEFQVRLLNLMNAYPFFTAYTNPLFLGVWVLFSLVFIHVMDWWPSSYRGLLGMFGYLRPLPAFASMALPLMFLIDW